MPAFDDVELSAAFSVHRNSGSYAVLLGAGVSVASGAPSAWEVQLSLVREVASLEAADPGDEPDVWYEQRFGGPVTYDGLLGRLSVTVADRQGLLRRFFEPDRDDPEREPLTPSAAHRAVASMVAAGRIRIVLTLNFDHLMEAALRDAGIEPTVLATRDDFEHARPLHAQDAVVIHVHGEYLNPSSMRNTAEELSGYDPELVRLLRQISAEYGILVSGWSARWDPALREILASTERPYLPMYVIDPSLPNPALTEVMRRRQGIHLAATADAGLSRMAEGVAAISDTDPAAPVTTRVAVGAAKRALRGQTVSMSLHDDLRRGFTRLRELPAMTDPDTNTRDMHGTIQSMLAAFDRELPVLSAQVATTAYWGDESTDPWWISGIQELADYESRAGLTEVSHTRLHPSVVLWYSGYVAAVARGRWSLAHRLVTGMLVSPDSKVERAGIALASPHGSRFAAPLHQLLAPLFVDLLALGQPSYDSAWELAEYLRLVGTYDAVHANSVAFGDVWKPLAVAYHQHLPAADFTQIPSVARAAHQALTDSVRNAPPVWLGGEHIRAGDYGARYRPRLSSRLRRDIWSQQEAHPLLLAGYGGGHVSHLLAAMEIVDTAFEEHANREIRRAAPSDRVYSMPNASFWLDEVGRGQS